MALKDMYFSISEAAEELKVSRQTIYRWIADKKIPSEKVGGVILVEKVAINKYAIERATEFISSMFDSLSFDALRQELGYADKDRIERVGSERDYAVFLVTRENDTKEKVLVGGVEITMKADRKQPMPAIAKMKLIDIIRQDYKQPKNRSKSRRIKEKGVVS